MSYSRRKFLKTTSFGVGAAALASPMALSVACQPPAESLGVALVGLGNYATGQLGPALKETNRCHLAGVVTGDRVKGLRWSEDHGFDASHIYSYDTFDQIADDPDIDIVYVVLPNFMHAEFTIRAAEAGKHVICEKPMAISVAEGEAMVAAAAANNVQLAIGYRLHHEPHNQRIMEVSANQSLGVPRLIEAGFGFHVGDWDNWRFYQEKAGGGALMDVGIYCIQAACYVTNELPMQISAQEVKTRPQKFPDVDETLSWQMTFPSGALASCTTSYNVNVHHLDVYTDQGQSYGLSPAFGYDGLQGYLGSEKLALGQVREQARHMDHFAQVIAGTVENRTTGAMGVRDMRIIEAIYQAIAQGSPVAMTWD